MITFTFTQTSNTRHIEIFGFIRVCTTAQAKQTKLQRSTERLGAWVTEVRWAFWGLLRQRGLPMTRSPDLWPSLPEPDKGSPRPPSEPPASSVNKFPLRQQLVCFNVPQCRNTVRFFLPFPLTGRGLRPAFNKIIFISADELIP